MSAISGKDVFIRRLLGVLTGAAVLLGAGCGGGAESTSDADQGSNSCLEAFTAAAPESLSSLARLSHAEGSPVTVGRYAGPQFTAETYDGGTEGDGRRAVVGPGACVVTEVSPDFGPLYIFVQADDTWHRLLESDRALPLVPDPRSQLEDVEQVDIERIEA